MRIDRFSGYHSNADSEATLHFEQAVFAVASHRPGAAADLERALEVEPDFVAAHALKGFAGVLLARRETLDAARKDYQTARRALEANAGAPSEIALVAALGCAVAGRLLQAACRLDARLIEAPEDFLALKLSHALRFMSGDSSGMLRTTGFALGAWSPSMDGYGFVLGCHAFGLEEAGHFDAAERFGRQALAAEPADAWGLHAIAHVCEMQGRVDEGVGILARRRRDWSLCNNFAYHMAWHLALFYLAQGRSADAVDLYDREVRAVRTEDFRDVANAVSLLLRLRQAGVDVGDRWEELATLARSRTTDTSYVFGSLHHLLALAAVGDREAAGRLASALATRAQAQADDQSDVAEIVGLPLARTVLAAMDGRRASDAFSEIAHRLPSIGGSNAQRDIFLRVLAMIAAEEGRRDALLAVLAERRTFRSDATFETIGFARLEEREKQVA